MTEPRAPIAVLVDREGLGDVILKRPFLKALRAAFPANDVWWIASHRTSMSSELRDLVGADVACVIADAELDGAPVELIGRLRRLPRFERVFDSRTKISTVALTRLVLRHRGFYCCLPGFVLCDGRPPVDRRRPRHIAWRMNAMIACAAGGPAPEPEPLTPTPSSRAGAARALPEGPLWVGLAPGSRAAEKNWPIERFIEVARAMPAHGAAAVFLLGPMEAPFEQRLRTEAPFACVIRADANDAPAVGLDRLIGYGARLGVLIANDNGVGHLLGAAGTPVVSLFGPTSPERWAPVAPRNMVLWSRDFGGRADIAAIPADPVAAAALAMLGRGPEPGGVRSGRLGRLGPPA